ncbi:hypothetical protein DH2020_006843 [Rehmannia glutinosa]|uniref:Kinesin-like protein n=1 Tax=Rehmannia glutinosa TaxID=99300 RepID=A0ABR0XK13_REHGL
MGAIGAEELMNLEKLQGMSSGKEEKILVLVRLRPLSEKEIARTEVADWECINPTTILYRNSLQERSGLPTAYSFEAIAALVKKKAICDEEVMSGKTEYLGVTAQHEKFMRKAQRTLLYQFLVVSTTIESSAREFLGKGNSTTIAASVNFVDLAGSERASQALSVGQRLKEGCHINRSLLTLGTVIRKLSKGRHGHVNYRDSKLTRILQPALGGNARTAIICTLSPARSHVEQSRNTLLFASCAKEVSTNAQVNVVMSDKALVKQLQKEVARLESELRTPGPVCDHAALLRKKDMQIEKLEKEVRELKKKLDLAHSQIEDLTRDAESNKISQKLSGACSDIGGFRRNGTSDVPLSDNSDNHYSSDGTSDPSQVIEATPIGMEEDCDDVCKEVRCIDESNQDRTYESFDVSSSVDEETRQTLAEPGNNHNVEQEILPALPIQVIRSSNGYSYDVLEQNIQDVQKTIDSPSTSMTTSGSLKLTRSQSCRANLMTCSPDFDMAEQSESTPPTVLEKNFVGRPEGGGFVRKQWKFPPVIYGANSAKLTRNDSQCSDCSSYLDDMRSQNGTNGGDDIPTLGSFVAGLREMAKLQYENLAGNQVQETGRRDDVAMDPKHDWPLKFEKLQKLIIEQWEACNVSLVHRTYFILLVKDDFTDSIYMDVEHRRLSFLKDTFSRGNSAVQDGRSLTLASSKKALRRERMMLSRFMHKRYTQDERNRIYEEWGISLNSKKRRLQLVHLLWSDTENMDHVTKSASIVAKLIGFSEHGQALKEMFGLSFTPPRMSRRSFGWKNKPKPREMILKKYENIDCIDNGTN